MAKPAAKASPAASRGRPSKYKCEFPEQARKLCMLGATDKDMAEFFGVGESTLNRWKIEYPEFRESLKGGKMMADANVAESLYKRATGYEHPEDDIKVVSGRIVITPTIKHYPPDATSMIFWLKNRRPDLWRDKQEQEAPPDSIGKALHDLIAKLPG